MARNGGGFRRATTWSSAFTTWGKSAKRSRRPPTPAPTSSRARRVTDAEKASLSPYGAAYRAARVRAEAYAAAAGLKVARVLAIRDGGQSGGEPQPMVRTMDVQEAAAPPPVAAPPPPFSPGVNSSTVAVQVEFALKR